MHSAHLPPSDSRYKGFTLVELLVVISIIGVLAALLLPLFAAVQNKARKVQAINDMRSMRVAILAYYADYQKYPVCLNQQNAAGAGNNSNGVGKDTIYGDPGPNALYTSADLFDILRAIDIGPAHLNANNALNQSQTVYWTGQMATNLTQPRGGISVNPVTWKDSTGASYTIPKGSFMDPWGRSYLIWIDLTKDGDLSNLANQFYSDISATVGTIRTGLPPMGLEFSSMGADGYLGTVTSAKPYGDKHLASSDDVVTWQ